MHAKAATVLNVTDDHMDRYQGTDDYRAAKLRVYPGAKTCGANAEDPLTLPQQPAADGVGCAPSPGADCQGEHLAET
ncbi:UDP-N-acetylmuramoyl-L-alanine--D-glutamate ligase, partial [Plesiomonas shigelloides]|nr:UDP-N-acetylmuramoyl-L-alanine--D-glutamate ligase [Plesiomonas shigelloides]